jgi:hypothetical protein
MPTDTRHESLNIHEKRISRLCFVLQEKKPVPYMARELEYSMLQDLTSRFPIIKAPHVLPACEEEALD